MANIDRIVNVQIALRTAAINQQNFSDLLLMGEFQSVAPPADRPASDPKVIIIRDADELNTDWNVPLTSKLYRAAQVFFSQIPHPPILYIGYSDSDETITDNIVAINAENSDWWALCDTTHVETNALGLAQWAEANEKLFVTALNNANNLGPPATDSTSTAALLKNGNFFRTAWWYHPSADHFPEVAIASKSFTKYPGSETWANQRLSAVNVVPMTETNAQNVFGKNGNTFEPFRNINITQNGKVAGGEWVDVIRFRDWLCEEIKIRVFRQMIDNRIPFTDPGIAIIRQRLAEALDFGVYRGGIAPPEINNDGAMVPSYVIQVPLSFNVPENDKANRLLRDVNFVARLAGAIHATEIKGALTYEMFNVAA